MNDLLRSGTSVDVGLAKPVSVAHLADELDARPPEWRIFVHRRTGEVAPADWQYLSAAEDGREGEYSGWEAEAVQAAVALVTDPDWVAAPDAHEINGWRILRDFAEAHSESPGGGRLLSATQGRGAFRAFRREVEALGLEQEWYAFRAGVLGRLVREWLEQEGIAHVD